MSNYVAKQPGENGHIEFTDEENGTWKLLYQRQADIIKGRACDAFIEGLDKLNMPKDRVPQCYEVTERLQHLTGWSVIPVPAMISLKQFFTMLSHREFPAASFIRRREELDYLKEPDIFHEYFGHCPMITDQKIADFMEWYGETALTAPKEVQSLLGRLFWFTIEFGLIQSKEGIRIFGGGILSSFEETQFAVDSEEP
jgi:phenylalanine-4-hydroxylase